MPRSNSVMVRPKNDGQDTRPREKWHVLREDPETREVEAFELTCVEGRFFEAYRRLGLVSGDELFDPYLDLDEGRMERHRVATYR